MNAAESPPRGRLAGLAGLLAALTFALFLRTGEFEFLNYDDPDYVVENAAVAGGLSVEGLRWAFGFHAANWHPLTWLAHMLDVSLFGLEPGPMHLVNAGLHALNAALLFLALAALTRHLWPSLLVAALFAAHPLRVECVAWISERKELLASAFFFGLLWAYARYARAHGRGAYLAALACLALGCMAKPMLVTAPFVLLLLDVWPLARWTRRADTGALLREKLPFFAVVAAASVLTWQAQRAGGALGELEALPPTERLLNAGAGVLTYLRVSFVPAGLAAFHPHPKLIGASVLAPGLAGAALVLALSILAWRRRAAEPAVWIGWLWFLGTLVPVIGLVQVGDQAWAERYTYLPGIGLALALVFGLRERLRARPAARMGLALVAWSVVGVLALVTLRTLPHWKDSQSLFERALAVTERNWIAHNNLGLVQLARRETASARTHFTAALEIAPWFHKARYNLALAQDVDGERAEAERNYRLFLAAVPGSPEALQRLAVLERRHGDVPEGQRLGRERALRGDLAGARAALERARELDPDSYRTRYDLGRVLVALGERAGARREFERAEQLQPGDVQAALALAGLDADEGEPERARARLEALLVRQPDAAPAWHSLGELQEQLGRWEEALRSYERAFRAGALPEAARAVAWILATGPDETLLDGARALELAAGAGAPNGAGDVRALEVLAAAHARCGDFAAAVSSQAQALERARAANKLPLQERLALYRAGQPYTRLR